MATATEPATAKPAPPPAQIVPPKNPFPNYTQVKRRIPIWVWHVGRGLSVASAITECVLLLTDSSDGLKLWWKLAIPLLPLLWLTAPGLWRNLCPLAASNQTPRLFKFTRGVTIPDWYREYAPVVGMIGFIAIVASRRVYFNDSGFGTMLLIGGSLVGAMTGGIVFKGKSGWCSSICPLLPVQRVYGQEPYVRIPNSHCQPCVGCTKNCYDFNPRVAYLADMADPDSHYTGYRRLFVGLFPGLIYCYFTLPEHPSAGYDYGHFGVYMAVTAAAFFLLETFLKTSVIKVTTLFGAVAISIYYWFAPTTLADTWFNGSQPFVWAMRGVVWALAAGWLVRNLLKEKTFVAVTQVDSGVDTAQRVAGGLAAARAQRAGNPEVTIAPSGLRLVAKPGATLLDMLEKGDAKIEAGCRMGVCGADPVCVVSGMENLSPIGSDERGTLDRLGFADNTRMACCARINGPVEVSATPERASDGPSKAIAFPYDATVAKVIVIGNGIAGVTAADHVRRRHPDCTIDVIADEPYPLYNRMGIARLVYGSSAMVGLQLLPQAWYDDNRVTCWLNTAAHTIDLEKREVTLGTGEALAYDRLILAMGSDSFTPPIAGYGAQGTFVLRRAADAFAIRSFVQRNHIAHAIIAGGGLLGLEAAYAIRKVGPAVTVLERGTRLLSRQLDERSATLLREYLEGLGLKIQIEAETAALHASDGRLTEVELKDGRTLEAGVFLVAAGISPLVDLARAAGMEVGRGVVVDDEMRTSAEGVFAVGDLAEHRGRIYGLWPAAVEQGEIAAENAVGGARSYQGTVPVTMLKVVGVDLLSVGRFEAEEGDTVIVLEDAEEHSYRKLVISEGKIVGAILIARQSDAPHVTAAAKDGRDVSGLMEDLERGDWECLAAAEPEPVGA